MEVLDDKYQIEQLLGQGGMGAVYRATHLGTRRTVAVKVIQPQLSTHEQFVARFRREAEAAGRLRHPNVVDVTDFGFAQTARGPVAYLVMEYLDGCTLAEIISEEGALPIQWVIDILEQVCAAVEEAHRAGIIHRDLKPDNIWLEPNGRGGYTVKVLDFGLVKLGDSDHGPTAAPPIPALNTSATEADTLLRSTTEEHATLIKASDQTVDDNLTAVGSVMGTPFYMSPEQCKGERLDTRSDIYSLGVVAYRLLTGETPFAGPPETVIELHKTAPPPPIREKNRKVPRKMARIVMSALAKDPAERPQSAAGFAASLRASWEGPGHLLRQAFALYSEHFPTFIKISLLGYAPFAVLALVNLSDRLIDPQRLSPMRLMIYGIALFVAMVITLLFAYFFVSAATVPLVVQLMIAPLRPVRISTGISALKRRWRIFVLTSLLVMTLILLGSILFVIPGLIAAIIYALYAPVVIMEDLGVRGTLRRSRTLSRRALLTVVIITLVQFALPVLVWRAAVTTNFTLQLNDDYSPRQIGFDFSMSGLSGLYQLLNVFVTPLTAIMASLLYLKTRKAGGESLRDTSDQFEALDIPRSKWQARMRSRWTSTRG
ncbi:MAG TPA: serine/threonine-protein kinase [Pyrinomonadaceae bacterium]|nr:serine/threonine-protein kinase [Pyrinomonadaceae bacterium]